METIAVRVEAVRREAQDVHSYELRRPDGAPLPPFAAGAHIDLHLPGGLVRSYSLTNAQTERQRYVVAVARDAGGRGGSRCVHERLHVGALLRIGPPRNLFPLHEDAGHSVLIAGGIGITPLRAMQARLAQLGRPWELHYASRTRASAAFADELQALGAPVHLYFSDTASGRIDLARTVQAAPAGAHFYCCGPQTMLQAFETATAALPAERVHLERFAAQQAPALDGGFVVELARSGRRLPVAPGTTILDTLLAHGVDAPYSCMQGICGACETRVLDGLPEHRDSVLGEAERAGNRTMMVCCSGARSPVLRLDL
ncbi:PDR/VanB family oxidoreductase [Pseudorhodoferax sp.]|uniref:PDR/VanB family oxidoreductase n=1 Tax=Pseudorhodoferax sp. TaxID=1993553 RepID=UPI002DD6B8D3|nr:PDR/VanB family oxidoreductase [Pseudorhodoferax sp.]